MTSWVAGEVWVWVRDFAGIIIIKNKGNGIGGFSTQRQPHRGILDVGGQGLGGNGIGVSTQGQPRRGILDVGGLTQGLVIMLEVDLLYGSK